MKTLDFRKKKTKDGRYTAKYIGKCPLTGIRLYDCPECNDPRGPLGMHAAHDYIATEYDMTGPAMSVCWIVQNNSREQYKRGLAMAKKNWKAI